MNRVVPAVAAALIVTSAVATTSPRVVDRYNVTWAVPQEGAGYIIPVGRPHPPTGR